MNFTFSEEELKSIRTLLGSKVLKVHTAHPWFTQIGWHGSRRCDIETNCGVVGLGATYVKLSHDRVVGELVQLEVIEKADSVPWLLADHKGYERRNGTSILQNREILEARVMTETVWLTRNDEEILRYTRDLGFFLITNRGEDEFNFDLGREWRNINGEHPLSNLYFGATSEQACTVVDVRVLDATDTRFGIHSFPGNGIIDVRVGEILHHRLTSRPV